jgi:hypothetical protein
MRDAETREAFSALERPLAYARIVSLRFRPETLATAMAFFRDVSTPLVRKQPGSLSIFGAGNDVTGTTIAISFWETLESLEASNAHPEVVDALMGYAQWIESAFVVEAFDLVYGPVPLPEPVAERGEWVRVTQAVPLPGAETEVAQTLRDRLRQVETGARACTSTLLLVQRAGRRVTALEFWSSHDALLGTESRAQTYDARLWRSGLLAAAPTRDTLRVYGRY